MRHHLLLICVCLLLGCGHNRYNETKSWGLGFSVPCGDLGQLSLHLGSAESTVAMVRGGSSFSTETIAGAGVFSGSGGAAKSSTFRSNEQLNEGNIVKIMQSSDVPEKVKIELAQNFKKAAEAPVIKPSAMQVREASLYANGYKGELTNQFQPTGVDKVVDGVESVVGDISSTTGDVINSTTESITDAVVDTTENISKTQAWGAIWTFLIIALLVFLRKYFKSSKATDKKLSTRATAPPEETINPPEMEVDPSGDEPPSKYQKSKLSPFIDATMSVFKFWEDLPDHQKTHLKKSAGAIMSGDKKEKKE